MSDFIESLDLDLSLICCSVNSISDAGGEPDGDDGGGDADGTDGFDDIDAGGLGKVKLTNQSISPGLGGFPSSIGGIDSSLGVGVGDSGGVGIGVWTGVWIGDSNVFNI